MLFFRRNQEKTPVEAIKEDLKKRKLNKKENESLSKEEKGLIQEIKKQTIEWNKNNVTRTKAYLDFYVEQIETKTKSQDKTSWLFGVQGMDSNPFRPYWLSVPQQAKCSEGALLVYSKSGQTFHFFLNSV